MPSIFVTPPGWSWDIALYFFFGGMAGGCYFLASMLRLVGHGADARVSRIGYYLAFPLINVCALLLIKDLGVPERFWHMLVQSERAPALMFKWWSPISFGSWIIAVSGILPLISFVYALLEGGIVRSEGALRLTRPLHDGRTLIGRVFLIVAVLLGLLLAGYTGILATVTNAPTWSREPLLPAIFMASGVATAGGVLFLLAHATGAGVADSRARVLRTALLALLVEAALLLLSIVLAIGHVTPYFLGWWAALFWLVVLPVAFVLPIALLYSVVFRRRDLVRNAAVLGAALLVVGGLLFRVFEVFGGQAYYRPY
jgi:protein NrfD